jgi:Tfp pilus assembly protein PilX
MSGATHHTRLMTFARRDDGQSLVLAVLLLLVLTIGTTATISTITSTQTMSTRDRQGARALNAAEAGLDLAANAVSASNGSPPSGVQTTTVDNVGIQWKATQVSSSSTGSVWNVDVRATSGNTVKVLREQVVSTVHPGTPGAPSSVYSYGLYTGDSSPAGNCATDLTSTSYGNWITNGGSGSGSAQIMTPVWVNNSLCLAGSGGVIIGNDDTDLSHPVSLYVQGNYYAKGVSTPVGTATDRIFSSTIAGGHCWVGKNYATQVYCDNDKPVAQGGDPTSNPNSKNGPGIYANSYSSQPASIAKPTVWETGAYNTTGPGPVSGCGTGHGQSQGSLKFDNDSSPNASLASQNILNLSPTKNFDCRTYDSNGNLIGQFTYVSGSPGTLTINGTVFIDGSITFPGGGSANQAKYLGRGTLYVDGTVSFTNDGQLCAAYYTDSSNVVHNYTSGSCLSPWTPTATDPMIEIVALNHANLSTDDTAQKSVAVNPNIDGFSMTGASRFQGIAFVSGRFDAPSGSAFPTGGVISDTAVVSGGDSFGHIAAPPSSAPGAAATPASVTTWAITQSSWRQCPADTSTFCS